MVSRNTLFWLSFKNNLLIFLVNMPAIKYLLHLQNRGQCSDQYSSISSMKNLATANYGDLWLNGLIIIPIMNIYICKWLSLIGCSNIDPSSGPFWLVYYNINNTFVVPLQPTSYRFPRISVLSKWICFVISNDNSRQNNHELWLEITQTIVCSLNFQHSLMFVQIIFESKGRLLNILL